MKSVLIFHTSKSKIIAAFVISCVSKKKKQHHIEVTSIVEEGEFFRQF
jgi:hypothetical protein